MRFQRWSISYLTDETAIITVFEHLPFWQFEAVRSRAYGASLWWAFMGTERNPNNLYLWFYILFLKDPLSPSYINFMPHKIVSPWGMCMCVRGELLQSHPTLCDPMVCSPPGFSVHGILQQEYWSGLPFPSPGDLPDPGNRTQVSCMAGWFFTLWASRGA